MSLGITFKAPKNLLGLNTPAPSPAFIAMAKCVQLCLQSTILFDADYGLSAKKSAQHDDSDTDGYLQLLYQMIGFAVQ